MRLDDTKPRIRVATQQRPDFLIQLGERRILTNPMPLAGFRFG
jgi:hypothetical protein